jgi:hypothetical protein
MARMKIFNTLEEEAFESPPVFNIYLSRVLAEEKNEARKAMLIGAIRNGSAATWAHFNLHGEFDFSDERMVDSMGLTPPKNTG